MLASILDWAHNVLDLRHPSEFTFNTLTALHLVTVATESECLRLSKPQKYALKEEVKQRWKQRYGRQTGKYGTIKNAVRESERLAAGNLGPRLRSRSSLPMPSGPVVPASLRRHEVPHGSSGEAPRDGSGNHGWNAGERL